MGLAKNELITRQERDEVLCREHVVDPGLVERLYTAEYGICFACGAQDDGEPRVAMWELVPECRRVVEHYFNPETGDREVPVYNTQRAVYSTFNRDAFDETSSSRLIIWLAEQIGNYWWTLRDDGLNEFSPSAQWTMFREVVEHQSRAAFLYGDAREPELGLTASEFVAKFLTMVVSRVKRVALPVGTEVCRGRLVGDDVAATLLGCAANGDEIPDEIRKNYLSADRLGAAPMRKASVSRYSPAGISLFYASPEPETAMAEIAAHDYTLDYAIMGNFRTVQELNILDFTTIEVPSIVDLDRSDEREDALFLTDFIRDITRPIKPDGRQHIDYAATQLIAELIRYAKSPVVDGMALPSAQAEGETTWVFFKGEGSATNVDPQGDYDGEVLFTLDPSEDWHLRKVRRQLFSDQVLSARETDVPQFVRDRRRGRVSPA